LTVLTGAYGPRHRQASSPHCFFLSIDTHHIATLNMQTTETEITEGDTVTLTVPRQAVGLAHADLDGDLFTVESVTQKAGETRLHVTADGDDGTEYALRKIHVEQVS
jgi:hypothetical protein